MQRHLHKRVVVSKKKNIAEVAHLNICCVLDAFLYYFVKAASPAAYKPRYVRIVTLLKLFLDIEKHLFLF